jgi:HTH-type transcriptional regulator/antitoxin HigA
MTAAQIKKTTTAWAGLTDTLYVPHNQAQCQALVVLLDQLIDAVGEDEEHPLASLMEVIGVLIEKYEDEHVAELPAKTRCVAGS